MAEKQFRVSEKRMTKYQTPRVFDRPIEALLFGSKLSSLKQKLPEDYIKAARNQYSSLLSDLVKLKNAHPEQFKMLEMNRKEKEIQKRNKRKVIPGGNLQIMDRSADAICKVLQIAEASEKEWDELLYLLDARYFLKENEKYTQHLPVSMTEMQKPPSYTESAQPRPIEKLFQKIEFQHGKGRFDKAIAQYHLLMKRDDNFRLNFPDKHRHLEVFMDEPENYPYSPYQCLYDVLASVKKTEHLYKDVWAEYFFLITSDQQHIIAENCEQEQKKHDSKEERTSTPLSKEEFENELRHGSCKIRQIRIMIVGHYGVGKTTLTYGLIGKNKKRIDSTDGIDLFRARCRIDGLNENSREWRLEQGNFMSPAALAAASYEIPSYRKNITGSTEISDKTPEMNKMKTILIKEKRSETLHHSLDPCSKTRGSVTSLSKPPRSSDKSPLQCATADADISQCTKLKQSSTEGEHRGKYSSEFYEKSKEARKENLEDRMKDISIDIWDFGGQNVFYTTHQSFLTSRCIYLLVINCAKDLNATLQDRSLHPTQKSESKIEDYIDFWISTITNYAKSEKPGFPRIILIGTRVDEVGENAPKRVKEVCLHIEERYQELVSKGQLVIKEDLFLNAKNSDEEKNASIREFILLQSKCHPHWEEPFPKAWLHLLDFIVTKREKGIEILTLRELKEFNQNSIVPLTDFSLEIMLQRQHEIGDIIFFNTKILKKIIILDPSFLISALKSLISTQSHIEKSGVNPELWRNLSTTGVVSEDTIKEIWSRNELLNKHADILLNVFQHMDILVKPKSYVGGKQMNVNQEKIFFIPCMIEESDSIEKVDKFLENSQELYEFYDISINQGILVPPAIGYRLLSFCTSMWPVVEGRLFTACGFFRLDLHHILILRTFPSYIRVYTVHRRSKSSISAILLKSVNRTLISYLETCLLHFHENFKIVSGCQETGDVLSQDNKSCNDNCTGIGCSFKKVEDVELLRLARYLNPHELGMIGAELGILDMDIKRIQAEHTTVNDQRFYVLHEWRKRSQPSFADLEKVLMQFDLDRHTICKVYKTSNFEINVMENIPHDKLDRILSDEELDQVAGYIGREYFQLSLELGLTVSRIEQIIDEHRENVLKRIKSLLYEWRKTSELKPTVKILGCALLHSGGDFHAFCQLFTPKQENDLWLPRSLFPK